MHTLTLRRPTTWARILLLGLTLVTVLLSAAAPAEAGSKTVTRVTGKSATANWTQVDGTAPGSSPVGNVHVGWMNVDETSRGLASVYGWIEDYDCEPGELPGHGHGIEEEPSGCTWLGTRRIESYDVPFTMSKDLTRARLKGTLTVYASDGGGHFAEEHGGGGTVVGRPPADVTWTAYGRTIRSGYTSYWTDGITTYRDRHSSTGRDATMGGFIGPMGWDPDLSGGHIMTYKAKYVSRTR